MLSPEIKQCANCAYSRYHGNPMQLFCSHALTYVVSTSHCGDFLAVVPPKADAPVNAPSLTPALR